jgi:hypothetical protein
MFSDHCFWRFQRRHKIALWARTHTAQQAPSELRESITSFHEEISRQRHRGVFGDKDIANWTGHRFLLSSMVAKRTTVKV